MIKTGPWRPFLIKATIMAIVLGIAFEYIARRYRLGIDWQVERCLPDTRLVLIDRRSAVPDRGALIAFRGRGLAPIFADDTPMVKILVGLPGDWIEVTPERTTVNGVEVAVGLALAGQLGHAPLAFSRSYTIPKGHFFAVGLSETSFDSRYFGLITQDQVIGEAWRLG